MKFDLREEIRLGPDDPFLAVEEIGDVETRLGFRIVQA